MSHASTPEGKVAVALALTTSTLVTEQPHRANGWENFLLAHAAAAPTTAAKLESPVPWSVLWRRAPTLSRLEQFPPGLKSGQPSCWQLHNSPAES